MSWDDGSTGPDVTAVAVSFMAVDRPHCLVTDLVSILWTSDLTGHGSWRDRSYKCFLMSLFLRQVIHVDFRQNGRMELY